MRQHNVILMLPGGRPKPSGKIVWVDDAWHFHVHAQSGWRLVTGNAWGIQEDILAHCEECGVETVHIYVRAEDATFSIALTDLRTFAVPGYDRLWGRMQNVSERHFRRTPGKVPAAKVWVPDEVAEVILATQPTEERTRRAKQNSLPI